MSKTKFFDLNHQAMPESRKITPEGDILTARQLVARAAIDKIVDQRPTFSQLYVAGSPYCRELLGFYPAAMGLGRFVLESHISPAAKPECTDEECGAVLYDRGFVTVSGFASHEAFEEADTAYEWIATALNRMHGRTRAHNPLMNVQARSYLAEMQEQGHRFIEEHNQIEADYSLESTSYLH